MLERIKPYDVYNDFWDTADFLKSKGLNVQITIETSYAFMLIRDGKVMVGMATNNEDSYDSLDGKICIENYELFDKWSKCPIELPIPINAEQREFVYEQILYIQTEEGKEKSDSFQNIAIEYPQ